MARTDGDECEVGEAEGEGEEVDVEQHEVREEEAREEAHADRRPHLHTIGTRDT